MSREQQLRVQRAVSLNRAIDEQASPGMFPWQPNWIDYRSSVANVDRREDRGDVAVTCESCGCEVDIDPAPHSPKCKLTAAQAQAAKAAARVCAEDGCEELVESKHGVRCRTHAAERQEAGRLRYSGVRASARTNGRPVEGLELLERMDQGLPLVDEVLEEAAAPDTSEGRAASSNTETGPAGPPRLQDDDAPRAPEAAPPHPGATGGASIPFRHVWTRDEVVAALRRWAEEHGHAPTQTDWLRRGAYYPTFSTAARVFGGSWSGAIEAAGLTPRGSGPRRATSPERESAAPQGSRSDETTGVKPPAAVNVSRSEGAVTLRDALALLVHATRTTLDALERELTIEGDPGELARVVVRHLGDDT